MKELNNENTLVETSQSVKTTDCKGLNILSLCDGMSCGQIALTELGIKFDKYFASEIKDIAIKATNHNFPDTIQIGDVNKISYSNGVLHTDSGDYEVEIDFMMFGSPCQSFSRAMNAKGRVGLDDKSRSGLFLECYRILKEVNPKYFLMENVIMKKEDEEYISEMLGVKPLRINSSLVSAQLRDRLYWTNIPNVTVPEDRKIKLNDILDNGYSDREKARALLVSDSRPLASPNKMIHRYRASGFTTLVFKSKKHYEDCNAEFYRLLNGEKSTAKFWDNHTSPIFDGVRYFNKHERARLQTVPEKYVECMSEKEAADLLGDGWTVDVIAHIFKGLKDNFQTIK